MTEDVADAAIGLMYAAARRVAEADRFVRAGRWAGERMGLGISLHRKAAGIVGLGRIGQAIARRCAGLGMDVAWTGPRAEARPALAVHRRCPARSPDALGRADPGDARRRRARTGMVDAGVLAALGPRGVLVNIARGSVVDEAALIDRACRTARIAAAGLDVFAREPGLDARFLALDNVVLAPHSASLTIETRAALVARILVGHRGLPRRAAIPGRGVRRRVASAHAPCRPGAARRHRPESQRRRALHPARDAVQAQDRTGRLAARRAHPHGR